MRLRHGVVLGMAVVGIAVCGGLLVACSTPRAAGDPKAFAQHVVRLLVAGDADGLAVLTDRQPVALEYRDASTPSELLAAMRKGSLAGYTPQLIEVKDVSYFFADPDDPAYFVATVEAVAKETTPTQLQITIHGKIMPDGSFKVVDVHGP